MNSQIMFLVNVASSGRLATETASEGGYSSSWEAEKNQAVTNGVICELECDHSCGLTRATVVGTNNSLS